MLLLLILFLLLQLILRAVTAKIFPLRELHILKSADKDYLRENGINSHHTDYICANDVYEKQEQSFGMSETASREIEVRVNWSHLLHPHSPLLNVDSLVPEIEIYKIDQFFTSDETQRLISESEKHGYGFTDFPKKYRGNLRLITIDPAFTDAVWTRLKYLIPKHVEENGRTYNVVGLNNHWRLAKYFPGDQFKPHCDESYEHNRSKHKSMFTVNIYMNDDFKGGETSFIFKGNKRFDVVPRTGLCLIFRQPPAAQLLHEGKVVTEGIKYLFRTDIMYEPAASKR